MCLRNAPQATISMWPDSFAPPVYGFNRLFQQNHNKEYCCSGGFVAVATKLGLQTGVAVSCQLRKLTQLLASDAVLMRQVGEIEKILQRQPPGKRK